MGGTIEATNPTNPTNPLVGWMVRLVGTIYYSISAEKDPNLTQKNDAHRAAGGTNSLTGTACFSLEKEGGVDAKSLRL